MKITNVIRLDAATSSYAPAREEGAPDRDGVCIRQSLAFPLLVERLEELYRARARLFRHRATRLPVFIKPLSFKSFSWKWFTVVSARVDGFRTGRVFVHRVARRAARAASRFARLDARDVHGVSFRASIAERAGARADGADGVQPVRVLHHLELQRQIGRRRLFRFAQLIAQLIFESDPLNDVQDPSQDVRAETSVIVRIMPATSRAIALVPASGSPLYFQSCTSCTSAASSTGDVEARVEHLSLLSRAIAGVIPHAVNVPPVMAAQRPFASARASPTPPRTRFLLLTRQASRLERLRGPNRSVPTRRSAVRKSSTFNVERRSRRTRFPRTVPAVSSRN